MGFVLRLTPEEAPLRGSLSLSGRKTYTHRTWNREQCEPRDPWAEAYSYNRARGQEGRGAGPSPHSGLEKEQEVLFLHSISHPLGHVGYLKECYIKRLYRVIGG